MDGSDIFGLTNSPNVSRFFFPLLVLLIVLFYKFNKYVISWSIFHSTIVDAKTCF